MNKIDLNKLKVIIHWSGFNSCALITNSLKKSFKTEEVLIVCDKSYLAYDEVSEISLFNHLEIKNIGELYNYELKGLKFIVQTGWSNSIVNKFSKYLKNKYNTKIVVSVDNIFNNTLKQFLGKFFIKYFFDKSVDLYIVPGKRSKDFLNYLGVASTKIHVGYYGYYDKIFYYDGRDKKKQILYVGEISKRKGIDVLLKVYNQITNEYNFKDWKLILIGNIKDIEIKKTKHIIHHNFLGPSKVSEFMRDSKIFILNSRLDHWGTVTCEAAACGCSILVSNSSGSSDCIVDNGINGYITNNSKELKNAIIKTINWDKDKQISSMEHSILKASTRSKNNFNNSLLNF